MSLTNQCEFSLVGRIDSVYHWRTYCCRHKRNHDGQHETHDGAKTGFWSKQGFWQTDDEGKKAITVAERISVLPDIQMQVYHYLQIFLLEKSYAPTRQEIADHFGFLSPSTAQQHLEELRKKGLVDWPPGKLARRLFLVKD